MGLGRWHPKQSLPSNLKPLPVTDTEDGISHRLGWLNDDSGYRLRCSCGWKDPKARWTESNALLEGKKHFRVVKWNARRKALRR